MTNSERERNAFMGRVIQSVWVRLNDVGIDYNYMEMKNHFFDMFKNSNVVEEVADVFYDRFISI